MVTIPYFEGGFLYKVRIENAYWSLTPLSWIFQLYEKRGNILLLYGLYLLLPFISLILLFGKTSLVTQVTEILSKKNIALPRFKNKSLNWLISTCFLLIVTSIIVKFTFNKEKKSFFTIQYEAHYQNWNKVLEAAKESSNNFLVKAEINRALYHTGQFGEDPQVLWQDPGTLMLTGVDQKTILWYQQDIFMDLGYINGAEHGVVECLEYYGEQPYLLKKLAIIHMAKGNIGTAKIYLEALRKTLFHGEWAEKQLEQIEKDPTLSNNPQVQHLRSMMMVRNHIVNYKAIDELLLELLERNPNNQMAFEYLMMCYMLTRDAAHFAAHVDEFHRFYPKHLPTLFEEAVLIIANDAKTKHYLQGKRVFISKQTLADFNAFMKTLVEFKKLKKPSLKEFPAENKDNYFFYYTFFDYLYPGT